MATVQLLAPHEGARVRRLAIRQARYPLGRAGAALLALLALTALVFRTPALASNPTLCGLFRCLLVPGMLAAYLWGYRALHALPDASGQRRAIVGFAAAFCVVALLIVPFDDIDLCCYINIGWEQAHYGLNPYTCPLAEVPGWEHDPMFRPYWQFTPSAYGVLFTAIARLVCRAGHGDWWLTLQLFRAVNVVAFGLTGWVVWSCCRRLGRPHPERALYLLLWNPLLVMT